MRLFTLALALFAVGCAEAPPVKATLDVLSFKAREKQPAPPQGISAGVAELTPQTIKQHSGLTFKLTWREADQSQVYSGGAPSSTTTRDAIVPIVPVPSFAVRIVNKTQSPLSFAKAQIQLTDSKGRTFPPYQGAHEISGRVERDITGAFPSAANNQPLLERLREIINKLPFVTQALTIAPGADWQGVAAFKMDVHDNAELHELLQGVETLTLKLGDLVFEFDRTQLALQVTCPAGTQAPSLKKCKLDP